MTKHAIVRTRRGRAAALSLLLSLSLLLGGVPAGAAYAPEAGEERLLVPLGRATGIKLFSEGILVVGLSSVRTDGGEATPAKDAGLRVGDRIVSLNGAAVTSTEELRAALRTGAAVDIAYVRAEKLRRCTVTPAASDGDGGFKLGAWVRDSMAGIGTLTFYDPESGLFGALGHGINDVDTGELMPLSSGSVMEATVSGVRKGESGTPGELKGEFNLKSDCGALLTNTDRGVYGTIDIGVLGALPEARPAAPKSEVKIGPATILANVEGDAVEEFSIEIKKIDLTGDKSSRNMTIAVTDGRLIEKTGGIVQGMSGSPILQNGKIVGAVTHVLINDPQRGYGIFIENMLEYSENARELAARRACALSKTVEIIEIYSTKSC